jgi:hypothetical protein
MRVWERTVISKNGFETTLRLIHHTRWWPWAQLLGRVIAIQVLVCPRSGGPRRIPGR